MRIRFLKRGKAEGRPENVPENQGGLVLPGSTEPEKPELPGAKLPASEPSPVQRSTFGETGGRFPVPEGYVLEEPAKTPISRVTAVKEKRYPIPEGFVLEESRPGISTFIEPAAAPAKVSKAPIPGAAIDMNKELEELFKLADQAPDPELERGRIVGALTLSKALGVSVENAYNNYDSLIGQLEKSESSQYPYGPLEAFGLSILDSIKTKGAAWSKGLAAFTPGDLWGADEGLYKVHDWLLKHRNQEVVENLQRIANGPLMPIKRGEGWLNIDRDNLARSITTWAVQLGDQVPLMLVTLGAEYASSQLAMLVAGGTAAVTGGPDPSDAVTVPALYKVTKEASKFAMAGSFFFALEAGSFIDYAESLGIEPEIAEKYGRYYGLTAGSVEYLQEMGRTKPFRSIVSRLDDFAKKKIVGAILRHVGGSVGEGLEEVTQQGLQNFFLGKAIDEQAKRDPEFSVKKPMLFEGGMRAFWTAAGVSMITRGTGEVTGRILKGVDDRVRRGLVIAGIPVEEIEKAAVEIQKPPEERIAVVSETGEPFELEGLEMPEYSRTEKVRPGVEEVNEGELDVGQTFTIQGKRAEVISKTEAGSLVKWGDSQITIDAFERLEVDEGSLSRRIVPMKRESLYETARSLWKKDWREYREMAQNDLLGRIERIGKINVRYFQSAEEIANIPKETRARIFTSDPAAQDLDEIASSLGVSDTELIEQLRNYEPVERPPSLKDYVRTLEKEQGTPLQKLLAETEEDEKLLQRARSTLRKSYAIGKLEGIEKERQLWRELTARKRAREHLREENRKIINDLRNASKRADQMYGAYAEPLKRLLSGYYLTMQGQSAPLEIADVREGLRKLHDSEVSPDEYELMTNLEKKNIGELTQDERRNIHELVMHYIHLNAEEQKIRIGKQTMEKEVAVSQALNEMKPAEKILEKIKRSTPSYRQRIGKFGEDLKTFFGTLQMSFDLLVESLAGPGSIMYRILFGEVHEGVKNQLALKQDAKKRIHDAIMPIFEKHGIKNPLSWMNEKVIVEGIELTRGERMSLYRHSMNEDNLQTILQGGFGIRRNELYKNTPIKLGESIEDAQQRLYGILKTLTDAEREIAGDWVDGFYSWMFEKINQVYEQKNGRSLRKIEHYWRKSVMPAERDTTLDLEGAEALERLKGQYIRIGISKGFTKSRVKSRAGIYLNSFFYDLAHSVEFSSAYVGLEFPLGNASRLLYHRTFKNALSDRYGPTVWKEIEQGLRDIAGEFKSYGFLEEKLLELRRNITTATLGMKVSVLVKQLLSVPMYLPYVKPVYTIRGFLDMITFPEKTIEIHKLHSPEFLDRVEGGFSRDVKEVLAGNIEGGILQAHRLQDALMSPIRTFDLIGVLPGRQGAVHQVLDELREGKLSQPVAVALGLQGKSAEQLQGIDPVEKIKLAFRYADYAMERTQASARPEHMSPWQRGKPVEKLFTMYGSQTNVMLNLLYRTWMELQRTKDPAALKKFALAVTAVSIGIMGDVSVNWIRARLFGRERRDKKWLDVVVNALGLLWGVRDFAQMFAIAVRRKSTYGVGISIPIMRTFELLLKASFNLFEMTTSSSGARRRKAVWKFVDSTVGLVALLKGYPYEPVKSSAEKIIEKVH